MLYTKTVYYPNANPPPVVTTAWGLTVGYYVQDTVKTPAYYIDTRTTGEYAETYTLELVPATATVEPGKTLTFTATVKNQDGDPPSVPVPVSVKVEVDAKSGGHDHGETYANRDKGSVSPAAGNNALNITFTSTKVSGTHKITATCDMCTNGPQTVEINVKVKESDAPGWDSLKASPEYALVGGEAGKQHHDNHYLTAAARANLLKIVAEYNKEFPAGPLLRLNDASLEWGGKFDILGRWFGEHAEHRRGDVIDIRANQETTAIPVGRFDRFEEIARNAGTSAKLHCAYRGRYICPACELDLGPNRHYHVYLLRE